MSKGNIRKYFDLGPTCIASTSVYTGGATGWAAGIAQGSTSASSWLTGISQSDDDQGRVGQSIAVETLDVRVQVIPDNTAGGHGHLRMIIYSDEEFDGQAAGPDISEVLTQSTIATGAAQSYLQPGYFGRFRVIEDKHWFWASLNAGAFQDSANTHSYWHEAHHDMKSHRVMWDQTNGSAVTNARKGHIFIMFLFENQTVAAGGIITATTTNPPGVQYTTRIRYHDDISA